jgi:hypothetical protein
MTDTSVVCDFLHIKYDLEDFGLQIDCSHESFYLFREGVDTGDYSDEDVLFKCASLLEVLAFLEGWIANDR